MAAESITFPSKHPHGDGTALLAGDRSSKKGLIVVHEWWGHTGHIQDTGKRISEAGFLVLVPDMYRGRMAKDFEEAGHLMGSLDWVGACLDIDGAASYLKSLGCTKVGVTGFCMGGALSLAAGVLCSEVSAVSTFYGIPKSTVADMGKMAVPTQGHWGKHDDCVGFSSPADFEPLEKTLHGTRVPLDWNVYDASHAFVNDTRPNFDEQVAKTAIAKLVTFMHQYLK
ncbi:hypothetical protein CAPTEDRAFT_125388 [Capitella teleta]|uniref:Dienelactone hydrolase domain-containing protein n=1 Tax=Capitella teleta TaxID=283909 RepID=R7TVI9_CAPTE|nr:hypothetical protein CAPTEDRAFT_125388 [Capitella teleta]|eukprot:ELT97602.1 hypothetical protein CAPTEDRAFT_125388 [Capitella teleta]